MGRNAQMRRDAKQTPTPPKPTHMLVPLGFLSALLQYLLNQPTRDVLGFVDGIRQLAHDQGIPVTSGEPTTPPKDPPNA